MGIDLQAVEALATDQASLKAAAGLTKPGKWSGLGGSQDGALIWGECAGSGANPYRVMADLRDLGSKCTCPSRKFPCKHSLALLWLKAAAILEFPTAEVPEYVGDWLKRRRGGPAAAKAVEGGEPQAKDIGAAGLGVEPAVEDPEAAAAREAAAAKRAEATERSVLDSLDALEQWIGDQLRLGLGAFVEDSTARCRRIAARLVDGKAAVLASRVDELPARLLALPAGDRLRGAVVELGKLVLLAHAFRAAPRDAEVRRAVAVAETREAVLSDPATLRVRARWEVLAEQVRTRRDGLVAHSTWLLNLDADGPRFAMLLDHYPASSGRRSSAFTPGERFRGEIAFFAARQPLRALLVQRGPVDEADADWPEPAGVLAETLSKRLLDESWAVEIPVLLPPGRIAIDPAGHDWWLPDDGGAALPIAEGSGGFLRGTRLDRTAALWSGNRLAILAAQTPWGRTAGHG